MPRPRKPTAQLEMSGAFDKNPARGLARANEPRPSGELGNPPSYLSKLEKKIWKDIRKSAPWIKSADAFALEAVCRLTAKMREGNMKAADYSCMRSLLAALGLTPGDRSKVSIAPEKKPEKDGDEFAISRTSDLLRKPSFVRRDFSKQVDTLGVQKVPPLPN